MSFDDSTVIVLMLVAALAGVLFGVLPEWRRLMSGDLPIRKHLRSLGVLAAPSFQDELRCALCAGRERCARRAAPLANCANAELFRKEPSGTIAARKA